MRSTAATTGWVGMLPEMLVATLRARGRWLLGWSAGLWIAIFVWKIGLRFLPIGSLPGWLVLTLSAGADDDVLLFTLVLPWLMGIPLLGEATRWLGEATSRETVAFLLTLPVSRWVLFLSGWGFHILLLLILLGISLIGLWVGQGVFSGSWNAVEPLSHLVALGLLLGLVIQGGMLIALYTASFRLGFGGAFGGLLVSFLLYGWTQHFPLLNWMRFLLPWYYYLAGGWSEGSRGLLGVMGGINVLLAVWLFWAFVHGRLTEAPERQKIKKC